MKHSTGRKGAERLLKQIKQPSYTLLSRITNWTRGLSLSRDKPLSPRAMSDLGRPHGHETQVQGTYCEGSIQGPGSRHGASKTSGFIPSDSATAIYIDSGAGRGLRVNVWMHACKDKTIGSINRVQRVGAQSIVGTFLTVATRVAEAEAHLATVRHRFWRRAVNSEDVDGHTYPVRNQPSPQEYSTDQEIQKIPSFAVVSSSRRAEER
jgi:hypothetical protein